jgi:hypothetical protein
MALPTMPLWPAKKMRCGLLMLAYSTPTDMS